jgi:hypothetical protein
MIEGATNPENRDEWALSVMLLWAYVLTGPPAACFFGLEAAEMFGIWPGATTENVTLGHAITLLILIAGLPISVVAFTAAILVRRRWREALPLWFLAAGFGMALVALWHAQLERYAYLSLLLFGLTATCVGCIVGIPGLVSFLTRYSS